MLSGWLEAAAEPSSLLVVWFHKSNSVIDSPVRSDMCRRLEGSGKVIYRREARRDTSAEMHTEGDGKEERRVVQIIKSWMSH